MSNGIPWIRERLIETYPNLDEDRGIDLNEDGRIRRNEIADRNRDHYVSEDEAQRFFNNNRDILVSSVPYFDWGSAFSPDNPIHELIHLESELSSMEDIQATYSFLARILSDVRLVLSFTDESEEIDPLRKMRLVHWALVENGVTFQDHREGDQQLLIENIQARILDCDTATFVLLAVAHEMGWPIYAVYLPGHVFVRWDEGNGEHINFETQYGNVNTDELYIRRSQLNQALIDSGVYFGNLSPSELRGQFYYNRSMARSNLHHYEEAIADCDRAIELNPQLAEAFNGRGAAKFGLGRYEEAIDDFDRAIELNPQFSKAFNNRGSAKDRLGRYEEAIADFDRAIELDPDFADFFNNRGNAKNKLGRYAEAIADFDRAIELNPEFAYAFNNRGNAKNSLGRYEEAIADFDRVIQLNPGDELITRARRDRARAQAALENTTEKGVH